MNSQAYSRPHQSGASLILGLVLLLIMTLLGLTAANSNLLQARTEANQMTRTDARSAAMQTLNQAEDWLATADAATLDSSCAVRCGATMEITNANLPIWPTAAAAGTDPVTGATLSTWPTDAPESRFYLSQLRTETVISASGADTIYFYRIRAASRLHDHWTMVESIVAHTPTLPGPCTPDLARGFQLDPDQGIPIAVNAGLPRCGRQAFRVLQ